MNSQFERILIWNWEFIFWYSRRSWWNDELEKKKECVIYGKAGESRTQFKNISSHASSCGMSRTPRFFLRDGIFSSFLFFFFLLFFPLFPSFPFVTLIRITFANHIYTSGELKCKMRRKSCEWFPRILEKKFLRFEEEDFIPLEPVTRLRVNFLLDREREMNFIFFFLYF